MLALAEIKDEISGPDGLGCCILEYESVLAKEVHTAGYIIAAVYTDAVYSLCIAPHVVNDHIAVRACGPGNQRVTASMGGKRHVPVPDKEIFHAVAAAVVVSADESVVAAFGDKRHGVRVPDKEIFRVYEAAAVVVTTDQSVVASLGEFRHALRVAMKAILHGSAVVVVSTDQSVVASPGGVTHEPRVANKAIYHPSEAAVVFNAVSTDQSVVASLGGVTHQ